MSTSNPISSNKMRILISSESNSNANKELVYTAGSIIEGSIIIDLVTPIYLEQLRLTFHASESTNVLRRSDKTIKNSLFAIQHTLWKTDDNLPLKKSQYIFPFVIQFPASQFPPSIDHTAYWCNYNLVAHADCSKNHISYISRVEKKRILYMPSITIPEYESSISKCGSSAEIFMDVLINPTQLIPGNMIPIRLQTTSKNNKRMNLSIELLQLVTLKTGDVSPVKEIVDVKHCVISAGDKDTEVKFVLPSNLAPTFESGSLAAITYLLKINGYYKRYGMAVKSSMVSLDIPIHVITDNYGMAPPEKNFEYIDINSQENEKVVSYHTPEIPSETHALPNFLSIAEYEYSLPCYTPERLPEYTPLEESSSKIIKFSRRPLSSYI
ncbi:hypothetical protein BDF14DRAFT_1878143 [Spinellus fusiger]|nr:hypothetical protein BDF14DRAFT_1878143 [Spinellus fusiger]